LINLNIPKAEERRGTSLARRSSYDMYVRIAFSIFILQIGHFLRAPAQISQQHRWPHGTKTMSAGLSKHILHLRSSCSSLIFASIDGVISRTNTARVIATNTQLRCNAALCTVHLQLGCISVQNIRTDHAVVIRVCYAICKLAI